MPGNHRFRFDGAVSVVTGGGSGIGRASARAFAAAGSDVIVSDVDEDGARSAAQGIRALGRAALAVPMDVTRPEELDELVARAIDWQGHLDLFFSNAGAAINGEPERIPYEDWEAVARVNIWPHVRILRAVLPHMMQRGSGYLLHTASAAGLLGNPATAPYALTKFAVVGLAESLAIRLSGTGVGVSVVCPLSVATNLVLTSPPRSDDAEDPEAAAARRGLGHRRLQEGTPPDQVAQAIVEGVAEGRLYILPHPEVRDFVRAKWEDPDRWVRRMAALWRSHPATMDPSAPEKLRPQG